MSRNSLLFWYTGKEDRRRTVGRPAAWRWLSKQAAGNRRTAGVNGFATCRLWRQPVAPGEERAAHLSRPPDGREKRFCPLLGLRPKGGAARHPCSIVLNMAAPHTWERFGCQTIDSILLPDTRQGKIRFRKRNAFRNAGRRLACEDFFRLATCRRQATYFFKREKVGKKRFSRLSGRGKRNRRRFRRRGSS